VFVGVLGGFTTFSSFGLDTLTLLARRRTGDGAEQCRGAGERRDSCVYSPAIGWLCETG
jgi:hypothetical protein